MANEITLQQTMQVEKGNFKLPKFGQNNKQVSMSGTGGGRPGEITAVSSGQGTSVDSAIVGTAGYAMFKNIDPAINVDWGPESAGNLIAVGTMKPGEIAGPLRLKSAVVLRFKGASGSPKVQVIIVED